jgi:uncharacterized small protein (DUF1192 family)
MMKLKSLQITPNGENGWGTKELEFSDAVTQLYGPNGTGKTPLIKSLAYCLGYPSVFRNDIYAKCHSSILTITHDNKIYKLERMFSDTFDVVVHEPTNTQQNFYNEQDYSKYLFELLNYEYPYLVSIRNEATRPYLSSLLPIFYVGQDQGYDGFYKPPTSFIKDQFEEMVRLSAKFPLKNSFSKRKNAIDAKAAEERARKRTHQIKSLYEQLLNDTDVGTLSLEEIEKQILVFKAEIEKVKSGNNIKANTTSSIDKLISLKMQQAREVGDELKVLEKKCLSIESVQSEIEVEINTLSLNEESRRIFMSFSEICSVQGCGLFLGSNESYGKNLLYLKDQIKDLVISADTAQLRVEILKSTLDTHLKDIENLNKEREKAQAEDNLNVVVDSIHKTITAIIELEIKKKEIESLHELEAKYINAENELNYAINKVEAQLSSPNKSSLDIIKFKSNLQSSIIKWVEIIKTKNIAKEIEFVDGFKPNYGEEKLRQLSGSTHLRAVLSFHAALFEQLIQGHQNGMRFLILDTPGQHDISSEDLDLYISALKDLADKTSIQIIFSTTTYKYESKANDIDWLPTYMDDGFEQKMFMGKQ